MVLRTVGSDVLLSVFVKPSRPKSVLLGLRASSGPGTKQPESTLEVALAAPPVDGAANHELIALVSKVLRLPKRQVEIASGLTSRHKVVRLLGTNQEAVRQALTNAGVALDSQEG